MTSTPDTLPPAAARAGNDRAGEYAIRIAGLEFAWSAGAPPVLQIDELQVAHGEHLCLAGPGGSGKSTLLGLVGGIFDPSQGTAEVLGTELANLPRRRRDRLRADHIGVVFVSHDTRLGRSSTGSYPWSSSIRPRRKPASAPRRQGPERRVQTMVVSRLAAKSL